MNMIIHLGNIITQTIQLKPNFTIMRFSPILHFLDWILIGRLPLRFCKRYHNNE